MDRATERTLSARAVELGRSADRAALPELIAPLDTPSSATDVGEAKRSQATPFTERSE